MARAKGAKNGGKVSTANLVPDGAPQPTLSLRLVTEDLMTLLRRGNSSAIKRWLKSGTDVNQVLHVPQLDKSWGYAAPAVAAAAAAATAAAVAAATAASNASSNETTTTAATGTTDSPKTPQAPAASPPPPLNGHWPLILLACAVSSAGVVEVLLKAGADPNVRNLYGLTALVAAVHNDGLTATEKLALVKLLHRHGFTLFGATCEALGERVTGATALLHQLAVMDPEARGAAAPLLDWVLQHEPLPGPADQTTFQHLCFSLALDPASLPLWLPLLQRRTPYAPGSPAFAELVVGVVAAAHQLREARATAEAQSAAAAGGGAAAGGLEGPRPAAPGSPSTSTTDGLDFWGIGGSGSGSGYPWERTSPSPALEREEGALDADLGLRLGAGPGLRSLGGAAAAEDQQGLQLPAQKHRSPGGGGGGAGGGGGGGGGAEVAAWSGCSAAPGGRGPSLSTSAGRSPTAVPSKAGGGGGGGGGGSCGAGAAVARPSSAAASAAMARESVMAARERERLERGRGQGSGGRGRAKGAAAGGDGPAESTAGGGGCSGGGAGAAAGDEALVLRGFLQCGLDPNVPMCADGLLPMQRFLEKPELLGVLLDGGMDPRVRAGAAPLDLTFLHSYALIGRFQSSSDAAVQACALLLSRDPGLLWHRCAGLTAFELALAHANLAMVEYLAPLMGAAQQEAAARLRQSMTGWTPAAAPSAVPPAWPSKTAPGLLELPTACSKTAPPLALADAGAAAAAAEPEAEAGASPATGRSPRCRSGIKRLASLLAPLGPEGVAAAGSERGCGGGDDDDDDVARRVWDPASPAAAAAAVAAAAASSPVAVAGQDGELAASYRLMCLALQRPELWAGDMSSLMRQLPLLDIRQILTLLEVLNSSNLFNVVTFLEHCRTFAQRVILQVLQLGAEGHQLMQAVVPQPAVASALAFLRANPDNLWLQSVAKYFPPLVDAMVAAEDTRALMLVAPQRLLDKAAEVSQLPPDLVQAAAESARAAMLLENGFHSPRPQLDDLEGPLRKYAAAGYHRLLLRLLLALPAASKQVWHDLHVMAYLPEVCAEVALQLCAHPQLTAVVLEALAVVQACMEGRPASEAKQAAAAAAAPGAGAAVVNPGPPSASYSEAVEAVVAHLAAHLGGMPLAPLAPGPPAEPAAAATTTTDAPSVASPTPSDLSPTATATATAASVSASPSSLSPSASSCTASMRSSSTATLGSTDASDAGTPATSGASSGGGSGDVSSAASVRSSSSTSGGGGSGDVSGASTGHCSPARAASPQPPEVLTAAAAAAAAATGGGAAAASHYPPELSYLEEVVVEQTDMLHSLYTLMALCSLTSHLLCPDFGLAMCSLDFRARMTGIPEAAVDELAAKHGACRTAAPGGAAPAAPAPAPSSAAAATAAALLAAYPRSGGLSLDQLYAQLLGNMSLGAEQKELVESRREFLKQVLAMDATWRALSQRDGPDPAADAAKSTAETPVVGPSAPGGPTHPDQQPASESAVEAPTTAAEVPSAVQPPPPRQLQNPELVAAARRAVLSHPAIWPAVRAVAALPPAPGPRPGVRVFWDDDNTPIYVLMSLAARRAVEAADRLSTEPAQL